MWYVVTIDIQRLMGCLLFVKRGLETSPYSDLFDPWHWSDVMDTFTRWVWFGRRCLDFLVIIEMPVVCWAYLWRVR